LEGINVKRLVPRPVGPALLALFSLLAAVYLATGSGRFRIVDEVSLFAVTESLAKRGALDTNAIAWTQWVNSPGEVLGAFGPEGDVFSKKGPAPAFLAVPFYLIGRLLPPLSMLQTAFWFNAVVTALTAVLLARTVLALGYRLTAALLAGALYGLGTIAWPYATHFFGEPLSALAILGVFHALLRLRQTGEVRYAAWAGVAAGVMVATSAGHAVLLAPFGVYLLGSTGWGAIFPGPRGGAGAGRTGRRWARMVAALLAFAAPLAITAGLLVWYNYARFGVPLGTGYHFEAGEGFTANWLQGLWGLLFSPYRGFFWYTPLALASVIAWPGFIRRHRAEGWLLATLALILIGLFGKWWMWWGGFAWGPRFLVPLAPLVVLVGISEWANQQINESANQRISEGAVRHSPFPIRHSLFALLAGLSVAVQMLAVSANYVNYEIALRQIYPTDWSDPLKYGPPALFNPAHGPVLGQVRLLLENLPANLILGWFMPDRIAWEVPLAAVVVGLAAVGTWWLIGRGFPALARAAAAFSLIALLATALLSADIYAGRPEYGTPGKGYAAALAEIGRRAGPADGIVTVAPYHYQVPMARDRSRLPVYGYATEPTPLHKETEAVLWRALERHPRLWLVTVGLPPADPANGVERWLAAHAFVAEDRWLDDARLVAFVAAGRLEPQPVAATGLRLGDGVRLAGVRTSALTVRPGSTLAVELTWQADASSSHPPARLRGFVQLLAADGRLVVGQDGVPAGGYAPGTSWEPGAFVTDRRGLLLPEKLAAGEYHLIAGLYDSATGQRLSVTDLSATPLGDFVRLGTVRVEALYPTGEEPDALRRDLPQDCRRIRPGLLLAARAGPP